MDIGKYKIFTFLLLLAIFLSACSTGEHNTNVNKNQFVIATTFYPLYEMTKYIATDNNNVFSVIPFNAEPHQYEASSQDIVKFHNADVFITMGVGFKPLESRMIKSLDRKISVISATKGIKLLSVLNEHMEKCEKEGGTWNENYSECSGISKISCENIGGTFNECASPCRHNKSVLDCAQVCEKVCNIQTNDEHSITGKDPHVWVSIKNMKVIVKNIEEGLIKAEPQNKQIYEKNYLNLSTKLDKLDLEYKQGLSDCSKHTILVNHNAFSYLGRDYGFEVVSISGLEPESEPTPQQIADLIDIAKNKHIKYIFYEELVDPRVAKSIAKDVGAKVLELNPIEGVKKPDENYFTIMQDNLKNLKIALECK